MANQYNTLSCRAGDQQIFKFGLNPDIDPGGVPSDLWPLGGVLDDSTITPPITFVSTNALDTDGGTGMRELVVQGIDTNGDFKTSTHATNGPTPVNIGDYLFVNRAFGTRWGSTRRNQGDITFTDSNGAPQDIAIIPVSNLLPAYGFGQTLQALFCVPRDWGTMHVVKRWAAVGKQAATQSAIIISSNLHGVLNSETGFVTSSTGELNTQGNSFVDQDVGLCLNIQPTTIIRLTILEITSQNTRVSGGFSMAKAIP